jgi:hypothetical protein
VPSCSASFRPDEVRKEFFGPVGLFGIAVTAGLLAYEIFGIKKCHALLSAGEDMERRMGLSDAQFKRRPNNVLGVINEPFAAALIYPAVLAAWTYLALFVSHRALGNVLSPIVFFAGLVGILLFDQSLRPKPKPEWLFKFARSLRLRPNRPQPPAEVDDQASASSAGLGL